MSRRLSLKTLFLTTAALFAAGCASKAENTKLQKVAEFDHQVTGVTVSETNRVFVNFPRWTEDAPISVAEVLEDGSLRPYPDAEWNAWRNTNKTMLSPSDHFVCVQSVVADKKGSLWVLDPGSPGNERVVKGAPKLVQIDLASNAVKRVIPFDDTVAPPASYLNDVRFAKNGRHAYITDSGKGALVVVDLESGKARRVLEGHPSTQFEKGVVPKINGRELRRPDGRAPEFNADGIALSPDGEALYWQALTGKTLYRVPTMLLDYPPSAPGSLEKAVETVGINGVADGLEIGQGGEMFITAPEENAVKIRVGENEPRILVQDKGLNWPDTLSEAPDGTIYVTASHIPDSPWFKPGAPANVPSALWKILPPR